MAGVGDLERRTRRRPPSFWGKPLIGGESAWHAIEFAEQYAGCATARASCLKKQSSCRLDFSITDYGAGLVRSIWGDRKSAEEVINVAAAPGSSNPPHGNPAAGPSGGEVAFPGLSPVEQSLVSVLLKRGLLTVEQVRHAQVYGQEHHRDLRQTILELNLISPDVLNQLAFEHLSAMASGNGETTTQTGAVPLSPDRTQHHRDVRKELQEKAGTASLSELVNQILERACDRQSLIPFAQ